MHAFFRDIGHREVFRKFQGQEYTIYNIQFRINI